MHNGGVLRRANVMAITGANHPSRWVSLTAFCPTPAYYKAKAFLCNDSYWGTIMGTQIESVLSCEKLKVELE